SAEPLAAILDPVVEAPPVAVEPEPAATASDEPVDTLGFTPAPAIPVSPASSEPGATNFIEALDPAEPAKLQSPVAAMVAAEPERPLAAEPAIIDDTSILPEPGEAAFPKATIRARLSVGIGNLAATGD